MMQKGGACGTRLNNYCENAAEEVQGGLRHTVVCPNVTGSTTKRIGERKRARGNTPCFPELFSSQPFWT